MSINMIPRILKYFGGQPPIRALDDSGSKVYSPASRGSRAIHRRYSSHTIQNTNRTTALSTVNAKKKPKPCFHLLLRTIILLLVAFISKRVIWL